MLSEQSILTLAETIASSGTETSGRKIPLIRFITTRVAAGRRSTRAKG